MTMRSRIDQNEEDIDRLEAENAEQEETIESLAAKVRDLQHWRRRHDFIERVSLVVILVIFTAAAIGMWITLRGLQ